MESRLEELAKLLNQGSINHVRVVGISGMGGIGKTSIARSLYERISHQYECRCYIDDVSKVYRDSGALGLQKQLLCQSQNEKNIEIMNVPDGTCLIWNRLHKRRALIILDNVFEARELEIFAGGRDTLLRDCLDEGSKVIIISRDQQILKTHGVDDIYQVQPLDFNHAVHLFCKKAFKSNCIMANYEILTHKVLLHAQGHPLAIKVLGSSLFGRDVSQWSSALARLREKKDKEILDVLKISYDELEEIEKQIFLDIACFFNCSYDKEYVKEILDSRGFHPEYGLQVLVDKSLITIDCMLINMHHLLRDLGRSIAQEKMLKKPIKWSRLWDYYDFHCVMSDNKEAKNLRAIVIDDQHIGDHEPMRADAISKMRNLELLILNAGNFEGSIDYLSNELRYLDWQIYPFKCLPQSFEPGKLVKLSLWGSKIKQLWKGKKHLHNLKSLDLSFSKNLIELPDFGDALNLEELYLQGCKQLKQIHPSIGHLKKLLYVYLVGCQSLTSIPHIGGAINLRDLYLQGCVKLRFVDPSIGLLTKLSHLNLKNCQNLEGLPKSILGLYSLEYLNLSCCLKLQLLDEPRDETHSVSCLWPSFAIFPRMVKLDLSCCNLVQIPEAVANLCCLERLDLSGNSFATLPSLKDLSKLYCLKLQHCKNLTCLTELPSRVGFESSNDCVESNVGLYIFNCPKLVERESHMNIGFSWMLQLTQAFHKDGYSTTESIIPGSKMPERFNNLEESTDNYISIDTSPIMNDNKWIGIVFCVIFKVPYKRDLAIGPSLEERYSRGFLEIPVNFYGNPELVLDKSDHVWLFFFNQKRFMYEWGQSYGGSSKCNIKIHDGLGFNVQVKNYGYFWVYEQDLQLSNPVPRKRKFLAIEQNEGRISAK